MENTKENKYSLIEISLNNGHIAEFDANQGEWDDYDYNGTVFVVKKDGVWVGIYNMDYVVSVVVK